MMKKTNFIFAVLITILAFKQVKAQETIQTCLFNEEESIALFIPKLFTEQDFKLKVWYSKSFDSPKNDIKPIKVLTPKGVMGTDGPEFTIEIPSIGEAKIIFTGPETIVLSYADNTQKELESIEIYEGENARIYYNLKTRSRFYQKEGTEAQMFEMRMDNNKMMCELEGKKYSIKYQANSIIFNPKEGGKTLKFDRLRLK